MDELLLTNEEIVIEICAGCNDEAKYMNDAVCKKCQSVIKLSAKAQLAKCEPIIRADQKKQDEMELQELEARLCPEDMGFEEYITALKVARDDEGQKVMTRVREYLIAHKWRTKKPGIVIYLSKEEWEDFGKC